MNEPRIRRRLAAILAADVVGYSALMAADEAGTHASLKGHLAELIEPLTARHDGRIVKLMGDGILVEFASVVDAVGCAVELQAGMAARNAGIDEAPAIVFRIGVNLGDVIIDGEDIQGDGVNVAARLEGLAEPGGIALSGAAAEQVRGKLDVEIEELGAKRLKGIDAPVVVHRVRTARSAPVPEATTAKLAERPALAVLPFDNLSGDGEQAFLADGMAEDIITGLSRFRTLSVIARNSSFAYKGRSLDVREVARELGARYVLEGSLRRGGSRIRVTGQLIDAVSGNHIWAERYDRDLDDIFALQDEVTGAIVSAIAPEIGHAEIERARRQPPESLDAWSLYQQGLANYYSNEVEDLQAAIEQFDRVSDLDPNFAPGFAMAADARVRLALHFPKDGASGLAAAEKKSRRAIELDARDPNNLWVGARVCSALGRHEEAVTLARDAVPLNDNLAMAHYTLGFVLTRAGLSDQAIGHLERALELSPRDLFSSGFALLTATALIQLGEYDRAIVHARRSCQHAKPRRASFMLLTAVLVLANRPEEAGQALEQLRTRYPEFTVEQAKTTLSWVFPRNPDTNERIVAALAEAGLPE